MTPLLLYKTTNRKSVSKIVVAQKLIMGKLKLFIKSIKVKQFKSHYYYGVKINLTPLADRVIVKVAAARENSKLELLFLTQQKKNLKRQSSSCWWR